MLCRVNFGGFLFIKLSMTDIIHSSLINKTVFDNGLTVLSESIPAYRSVSIGIWIKTGSRYEEFSEMGLVHFIEHMLFKGTKTRNALQIAMELEKYGGNLNAFTSKEETCFYAHVLDSHLKKGIEVLADMICNPLFDPNDIKMEKQVVLEEISSVKDTPEEYVFDIFQEKVFPDQSLGFPILGKAKHIHAIKRDQIISFFDKFYKPDNIIVAVAGNVNHNELVDLVGINFNLSGHSSSAELTAAAAQKNIDYSIHKNLNQSHICIGGHTVSYLDEKRFDLIALNTYLGAGLSSVLFQVLREELGYVYSVYSFLDFYRDTGILGFYLGTDQNNREPAIERLYIELKKLVDTKLKPEQVVIIKEQMKGSFFLSLESTFKRMTRLAKNEIYYKKFISYDELIDSIERISTHSIHDAAEHYLIKENLNCVSIIPGKN